MSDLGDNGVTPPAEDIKAMQPATTTRRRDFDPIVAALAQIVRERHAIELRALERRRAIHAVPKEEGRTS